ncbi:MAG TPA: tRNA lysidine(34) synthetase TilS [Hanamia sp.]|nr:tRNA lysidine(34) synthetase TilS [Hanamia sp.]
MSLLKEFINNIQQQNLFHKNDYLLLAISGGADSVALCELCFQAGFHFEIAHCNFQLRGEESERDEKFVLRLGDKYRTKVFVKKFETNKYAEEHKTSIQVAARELRYGWFEELLKNRDRKLSTDLHDFNLKTEHHPSYLLTAHHANDNIETLLMNFFKGTGIKGLQGILPKQGKIIRPLLFAKKEEILLFIKENNLEFVEDSSNNSDKYTRNYLRHQLIPSIQKVFRKAEENLMENIDRFKEIEILYQQSIELHKKKLLEPKGNEILIPVLKLLKTKPLKTVIYEIIKEYGFTAHQTDGTINLLRSESGKYISSSSHRIIKNRNWLIVSPLNNLEANHILINESDTTVDFEQGELKLKKHFGGNEKPSDSNEVAMLDLKNITFPLLLRKWKQGDYFYPLGMHGKKKLGKFFIDQKMSLTEKEKIWVIESNKKIIWIIGKRIDDRFKITEKTKNVLSIHFN